MLMVISILPHQRWTINSWIVGVKDGAHVQAYPIDADQYAPKYWWQSRHIMPDAWNTNVLNGVMGVDPVLVHTVKVWDLPLQNPWDAYQADVHAFALKSTSCRNSSMFLVQYGQSVCMNSDQESIPSRLNIIARVCSKLMSSPSLGVYSMKTNQAIPGSQLHQPIDVRRRCRSSVGWVSIKVGRDDRTHHVHFFFF